MTEPTTSPLRPAAQVTFTWLPCGGAVAVDSRTLQLAECGERVAEQLNQLLNRGVTEQDDTALREFAAELVKDGWLLPYEQESDGAR